MLKKIFFFILLYATVDASVLFDKVKNLVGEQQFTKHRHLLSVLFKLEDDFYIGNHLRYPLILETLKENGILKLRFKQPTKIEVEFITNNNPIKSLKILNDTLRDLGYYYYFTKSTTFDKDQNILHWTITFNSQYILDPLIFISELKKKDCHIIDISKSDDKIWKYEINMEDAKLQHTIKIDMNEKVILEKPLNPYYIQIPQESTHIKIISRKLNHWFAHIVFYDKDLNILKIVKQDKKTAYYKDDIPQGTKYIKITDLYNLINIKRGLSIIIK